MFALALIFYSLLFGSHESLDIGCQHKLKKINYTLKYNEEPAICQNAHYRYGGCYCKDGASGYNKVNKKLGKKVRAYYDCFKQVLGGNADKVLLVTYKIEEPLYPSHLSHIINCYGLNDEQVFFSNDMTQSSFVQAKLLDKTNKKLQASNIISREDIDAADERCSICPLWNDYD